MARKSGSYKFEKRQKELKKQKKRQEKLLRKQKGDDDFDEFDVSSDAAVEGNTGETADTDVRPPDLA